MKKYIYKNEEIDSIILDESFIQGFNWINDNDGLEMDIDWNGQQDLVDIFDFMNVKTKLKFSLVYNIQFNFEFKGQCTMGALEITSFSYIKKLSNYEIEFKFDFSPVGYIKFNCNDFYFEIIEN